ncbi:MAG: bacillithiol biosynthesis cysteine-adding enzyme BshC [Polaribacter sp.]|nr:bacillithiol biosynthesis cysteine-adding enzyme BshC [Polaribacter sp.]MDG1812264.1 bacillithiol biosynthesis cysteine-adding enzyme BshC [Polaribacter sp.]MDG1994452.1 bacillithiol biosynthesis cysteine-adding enzyme BshC [Polaribacter sp.]
MKVTQVPFQETGFFSKIIQDYSSEKDTIKSFYNNFSDINGFKNQLEEKRASFSLETRKVLVAALHNQYNKVATTEETNQNINALLASNTFTVTTGHQLNLFTGPLYFLYKIISTINLAEELSLKFPKDNFVPVYWMATEDHDFDEINFFNFKNQKVQWKRNDGGAVGHFSTEGLEEVFTQFSNLLGTTKNADFLRDLFTKGYLEHTTLAAATRYIANQLFAKYGLVIVDGNDQQLKQQFVPFIKQELEEQVSFKTVSKTISEFEKNYKVQVNPREINLFYLGGTSRERILFEEGLYKVNNTDITFSKEEILQKVKESPQLFSPNVIMRPLFQEVVLPNLAYIGGGGELAYWLELKAYFNEVNIPFPILLLRNSVQIISVKQQQKANKLAISSEELFLNLHDLLKKKVNENSNIEFNFLDAKTLLEQQFYMLRRVANQTDESFVGAVDAQEKKQLNGLDNLEKRLLRAEKRKQKELIDRITKLKLQLFPNESLEERQRNFSEYYLEYGDAFVPALKATLKPLDLKFTIIEL